MKSDMTIHVTGNELLKFFERSFSEMKTKTEHGAGRYTSYNPGKRKGCHNLLLQCRCIFGICLIGIKPHVIFSFALDRTSAHKSFENYIGINFIGEQKIFFKKGYFSCRR